MTTRPYEWPWDGPGLDPRRLALLVVGGQEGPLERVAKVVRDAGGLVVCVVRDGDEAEFGFAVEPGDVVLTAAGVSAFYGSALDLVLRCAGRTHLAVGGVGLETEVYSTVTSANDRGYECLVLADACLAHDDAVGERALASMTMSGGIFGAVGTTADLLELLSVLGEETGA